jgi:hypothetical protein
VQKAVRESDFGSLRDRDIHVRATFEEISKGRWTLKMERTATIYVVTNATDMFEAAGMMYGRVGGDGTVYRRLLTTVDKRRSVQAQRPTFGN